jgi:hypothetical protein
MTDQETPAAEPAGLDVESAVADIAESLALVPAKEEEEPPKEADAPLAEPVPKEVPEAPPAAAPEQVEAPPDTWRKEAKEAWTSVPPIVREELRKREQDIARYVETSKVPVSVGKQFTEVVTPYLQGFEKAGVNVWDSLSSMLKLQDLLSNGAPEVKSRVIHAMAQVAGVKLGEGEPPAPDATTQYVQMLEQRLEKLEGGVRNVASTVDEARVSELTEAVQEFAADTVQHPYFEEVASEISHFIQTGAAKTLQQAYDLAVAASPLTRQKYIDSEVARVTKERVAAEAEKVEKARKASGVRVRSTGRAKVEQPLGSIDDTIKDALADIRSRH